MTVFITTTPSYGHPSSPEEGTTLGVQSQTTECGALSFRLIEH